MTDALKWQNCKYDEAYTQHSLQITQFIKQYFSQYVTKFDLYKTYFMKRTDSKFV